MRVAVLGKGGRECAIVWKLSQSPLVKELYAIPGNPGTERYAKNVNIKEDDFDSLLEFVRENKIDLVIPGPEAPIAKGVKNFLEENSFTFVFSPPRESAFLEASKIKAKQFMERHGIPTAEFVTIESYEDGVKYVKSLKKYPVVIKADGLAQGKGVSIAYSEIEAISVLQEYIEGKKFGEASRRVVIEKFLEGWEYSVFIVTDGENYVWIGDACDYKRAYDNDRGPNTGGMGSVSPAPFLDEEKRKITEERIIRPTIEGLKKERIPYAGFLYFGLIWTSTGPMVLEFNIRLGDPEAQVILPRLKNDLLDIVVKTKEGKLSDVKIEIEEKVAICLVFASGGYPVSYEKGKEIKGLEKLSNEVILFHAGTAKKDGKIYTAGGRVLNIVALGEDFGKVREVVYREVEKISFENMFFRKDIGKWTDGGHRWRRKSV